jgi:hypothetical protein
LINLPENWAGDFHSIVVGVFELEQPEQGEVVKAECHHQSRNQNYWFSGKKEKRWCDRLKKKKEIKVHSG